MMKLIVLAALALAFVATPVSLQRTTDSLMLTADSANAVIGRPATPRSVAGVHRRAHRAVRRCVRWYGGRCVGWI